MDKITIEIDKGLPKVNFQSETVITVRDLKNAIRALKTTHRHYSYRARHVKGESTNGESK
jgi:hypothetical protein